MIEWVSFPEVLQLRLGNIRPFPQLSGQLLFIAPNVAEAFQGILTALRNHISVKICSYLQKSHHLFV